MPMSKRRYAIEISNLNEDPRLFVDRNEIMKLTKVAKSWEFTCSFCFKKFPSAQAMGGHQNAHRSERLEEKRLFVRDPIGYRKRAYIRALMKAAEQSAAGPTIEEESPNPINPDQLMHASPPKTPVVKKEVSDMKEEEALPKKNCFHKGESSKDGNENNGDVIQNVKTVQAFVVMNFFPPKELNLADSVGVVNGGDAKGKAAALCVHEFNINGGYNGIDLENLDLTLKL